MNEHTASWPARPGQELGGFEIESVAGRGGMGIVYCARQRFPQRKVALKVIAPEFADDPQFAARFERETAIAAQLEHPNVIPVYSAGDENGTLYLAMRFVDGTDLRKVIRDEGLLDPQRAATIVDQVAQALDAAHSQGLVHRDVKPANILIANVSGREHVYLTDFGLTRQVESSGATVTGPDSSSGRSTTSRPSRLAAIESTPGPTSTPSVASSSTRSPEASRFPTAMTWPSYLPMPRYRRRPLATGLRTSQRRWMPCSPGRWRRTPVIATRRPAISAAPPSRR